MRNVVLYCENPEASHREADERLIGAFGEGYASTADFSLMDIPFGFNMDDLREKLSRFQYAPVSLPQTVVLVRNAERLSEMCQGALLTELERNSLCFVLCSRLPLLSTVESRCEVVNVKPVWYEDDFYNLAGSNDLPEDEESMLRKMVEAFSGNHREYGVLKALNLYKEKDSGSFFAQYKEECFRVFRVLEALFEKQFETSKKLSDAESVRRCSEAVERYLKVLPTANEFNAALYTALA